MRETVTVVVIAAVTAYALYRAIDWLYRRLFERDLGL